MNKAKTGIRVERVSSAAIRDQAELLAEYADECSNAMLGRINPQWDMYAAMERAGALKIYAAYVDDVMVGFSAVLHHVQPHYGTLVGVVESLFVGKAHRPASGRELMLAIEADARLAGCKAIVYAAPAGGELEAVLGKRYPRAGSSFCKPLG